MKKNEVPRYGVHDGVKYSPRRSIIVWCANCGTPFIRQGRGRKKYCKLCSINKDRQRLEDWKRKNDYPYRDIEEERERWRKSKQGKLRKKSATTNYVPGSLKDKEDIDWDKEMEKIKKLKKATYADSYLHKYEYYD